MALTKTQVSELYVAIFNRASEGTGNTYWQGEGSAAEVAQKMLDTVDAKEYFGTAIDDDKAFIEHIYINTLGKTYADDAEGIDFWVARLANGESRGEVVAALVVAATDPKYADTDAQKQFLNRVEVSDFAADNIQNVPENFKQTLGFDGDLVVTENPDTISPAKKAVEELAVETDGGSKGETSLLTEALANLDDAKKALADFLEEGEFANETAVGTAKNVAEGVVNGALAAAQLAAGVNTAAVSAELNKIDAVYTGKSDGVQAALETDAQVALDKALTKANEAVAAAETDIAEVTGLTQAIAGYNAAVEADKAAADTLLARQGDMDGAETYYNGTNTDTVVIAADGSVKKAGPGADLIIFDATTETLKLATGITETTNPGITALLNASQAHQDAAAAKDATADAVKEASVEVNKLDPAAGALAELANVGAGFTIESPEDAAAPTEAEIQKEIVALIDAIMNVAGVPADYQVALNTTSGAWEIRDAANVAVTDTDVTGDGSIDASTELKALNDFQGLLDTLQTEREKVPAGPLFTALDKASDDVATVEGFLEDLDEALVDYAAAKADVATLEGLKADITAAEDWFEDNGYEAPVNLTNGGTANATLEDDIFLFSDLAGGAAATITKFGDAGFDSLFVGEGYSLVDLGTDSITKAGLGNQAEFEIFYKQVGGNLQLFVETETFGGNLSNTDEIVQITLTGTTIDDIALDGSFINAGVVA